MSKCTKHLSIGPLLEVDVSKKCTPLWREADLEVKKLKTPHARTIFESSDIVSRGRHKGFCTLSKVSKVHRFCSSFKNVGRRGTFEEDLQRCLLRGKRSARDMFVRDVRRSGCKFLDISSSKSGPTMVCFVHFDLEMCFAPQRRALVQHLNFQKWSERGVLCTF